MKDLLVHPSTRQQLDNFQKEPAQAVMIVGPSGSGKLSLAQDLAESILELKPGALPLYAHALIVQPSDGKTIGIEAARQLEQFLRLKVPGSKGHDRVIIIENGQLMTAEAQNALLKTLEEPPAGTVIIITVSHELALLPTVRSRTQAINIQRPDRQSMEEFFVQRGHKPDTIARTYALSGGLIGLMNALLEDEAHPLMLATEQARQLLSQPVYERLISVDALSKDKALAIDTVDVLQRMARLSLQTTHGQVAKKWQTILAASYETAEALAANAQAKLALTKLVLQF